MGGGKQGFALPLKRTRVALGPDRWPRSGVAGPRSRLEVAARCQLSAVDCHHARAGHALRPQVVDDASTEALTAQVLRLPPQPLNQADARDLGESRSYRRMMDLQVAAHLPGSTEAYLITIPSDRDDGIDEIEPID